MALKDRHSVLTEEELTKLTKQVEKSVEAFWTVPEEEPYRVFLASKLRQDLDIEGVGASEDLLIERVATLYSFCRVWEKSLVLNRSTGVPVDPNPPWNPVTSFETYMEVQKLMMSYMAQLQKAKESLYLTLNERTAMMMEMGAALRHSLPDVLPELKTDEKKLKALLVELNTLVAGRLAPSSSTRRSAYG